MNIASLLAWCCVGFLALSTVACGGEEMVAEPNPTPDPADRMEVEPEPDPEPIPIPTPDADPAPDDDPMPDDEPAPDDDPMPDAEPNPDPPPEEESRLQLDVTFERSLGTNNHQPCAIVGVTGFSYTLQDEEEQTVAEASDLTCEDLPLVIDVPQEGTFRLAIEATSAGSVWEATCMGFVAVEGEVVEGDCAVRKITEEPLDESLHIDLTWALPGMPSIGENCTNAENNYAPQTVFYTLRDSQGQVVFTNITDDLDIEQVGLWSVDCERLDLTFGPDLIGPDTYSIEVMSTGFSGDHSSLGFSDIDFRPFWKGTCTGLNVTEGAQEIQTCEVAKLGTTLTVAFLLENVSDASENCLEENLEVNYRIFNGANELFDERVLDCLSNVAEDGYLFRVFGQRFDIDTPSILPVPPDTYRIEASGTSSSGTWEGSCMVEVSEAEDAVVGCELNAQ